MSRADRIVARLNEEPRGTRYLRPKNKQPKQRSYYDAKTGKVEWLIPKHHRSDDRWWRLRFADLVERKQDDGGYEPRPKAPTTTQPTPERPELGRRPEGMSRQVHRLNYRRACKTAGVDWRAPRGSP